MPEHWATTRRSDGALQSISQNCSWRETLRLQIFPAISLKTRPRPVFIATTWVPLTRYCVPGAMRNELSCIRVPRRDAAIADLGGDVLVAALGLRTVLRIGRRRAESVSAVKSCPC